jgi:hypothetical protein
MTENPAREGQLSGFEASSEKRSPLRFAVIGAPRSGNTWVRGLLAALFGLEEVPVHHPDEIDWEHLPARCVLQIHWYPIEEFVATLQRHEIRVVVVARHPLDVLMSWLNYVNYVHLEGLCRGGGACSECAIVGALPRSQTHLDYATGEHGRLLLCYSAAWWKHRPHEIRLRYEDLVAETATTVGRLVEQVGEPPVRTIAEAVEARSIFRMKPGQETWHYHFWLGQPGLWRYMIPAAEARAIAAAVPEPFEILGYECDPDQTLTEPRADLNWLHLQLASTRENLNVERVKHRKTKEDLTSLQANLERTLQSFEHEQQSQAETRHNLAATQALLDDATSRLAILDELGPALLGIGLRMKRVTRRLRWLTAGRKLGNRGNTHSSNASL